MKFRFISISRTGVIFHTRTSEKRGITLKILMPELWTLCTTLSLTKFFASMKFQFNSISRTGDIFQKPKLTRNVKKEDKSKNIYVRVMDLVHGTSSNQGISI